MEAEDARAARAERLSDGNSAEEDPEHIDESASVPEGEDNDQDDEEDEDEDDEEEEGPVAADDGQEGEPAKDGGRAAKAAAADEAAAAAAARDLVTKRRLTAQLTHHLRQGTVGAEQVLLGLPRAWCEDLSGDVLAGGVFLTTYAVVFLSEEQGEPMSIALAAIHQIEKKKRTVIDRGYQREIGMLKIYCKDARVLRLFLRQPTPLKEREISAKKDEAMLTELFREVTAAVRSVCSTPETVFQRALPEPPTNAELFRARAEFARMGVLRADSGWRLSTANKDYLLCPTYPRDVVIPESVTDAGLESVATFRSQGRFPMLCWLHPHSHTDTGDGDTQARAAIVRCSQPCVGVFCNSSAPDQDYMEAVLEANVGSGNVCIVDARPLVNARANRCRNGGFESTSYKSCELEFADIENVHAMRASLDQLHAYFTSTLTRQYAGTEQVERTKWLQHVGQLLVATAKIVAEVDKNGRSVVVHCSDGWDRTSQLVSLAQLCLDPYYRTFDGFQVLVEKEWNAAGHKFRDRTWGEEPHERSPVFFQFLDCIYQLMQQFPDAFQLNEWFLIRLTDYLYDNSCNNFLYNSVQEREAAHGNVPLGVSCWTLLRQNEAEFLNPIYSPDSHGVLAISLNAPLTVWVSYLKRWMARPVDGRIIDAAAPDEAKRSKLPKSMVETSSYAPSEIWSAPDPHWISRTIAFCPCVVMVLVMAIVVCAGVFGFLIAGRPATDVSTVGFETRGTVLANQQHAFELVAKLQWYEDVPSGASLAQSGAAVPAVHPSIWFDCNSCEESIEIVVHGNTEATYTAGDTDVFSADHLRSLCVFEANIIGLSSYKEECARADDRGGEPQCCAAQSVPRMILRPGESSCNTIDENTVAYAKDVLSSCPAESVVDRCAGVLVGFCGEVGMATCGDSCVPVGSQEQRSDEMCGYPSLRSDLLDVGFDGRSARYIRSRICLRSVGDVADPESTDLTTEHVLANLTKWTDEQTHSDISVYSDALYSAVATGALRHDIVQMWIALVIVICVALLLSNSLFVALLGVLHSMIAWPLTYFLYVGILGYDWFPCPIYISVYLVLCLGVDDVFAFCDMWSSSPASPPAARLTWVWQRVGTPSLVSALSTAFLVYANVVSFTAPVRLFSIFMACLVLVRYLLFCMWLPVVMLTRHITVKGCTDRVRGVHTSPHLQKHTRGSRCCLCRTILIGLRGWHGVLWSCRWPLFVVFGMTAAIMGLFASHAAERADPRLAILPDGHLFQRHLDVSAQFATDVSAHDLDSGIVVHMLWGILPVDGREAYGPTDPGVANFDEQFDLSDPAAQRWMLTLMADLRRQSWVNEDLTPPSFIEAFDAWLALHVESTDVESGGVLCYPDVQPQLPLPAAAFRSCLAAFRPAGTFWRQEDAVGQPTAIAIAVKTRVSDAEYEAVQPLHFSFDMVWQSHARVAPAGCNKGFFTSRWFARMDSQQRYFHQQGATSVLSVFIVIIALLCTTRSAGIALLGCLSVVCSVACALGVHPLVLQRSKLMFNLRVVEDSASWELGMLETLMIPLLVAQATGFVLHMGYAYNSVKLYSTARERSAAAIETVGVPIVASACGTFGLGFVMRHSELEFFHDGALLLMLGSMCSTVFVLGFFLAGLMIFGPEQTRRTIWPGGHTMGAMLTSDIDAESAERGGASADWRRASDSEERERLIFVSLKRTAAALTMMTDENRMLRHEIKELRGDEDDEESDPEPPQQRSSETPMDARPDARSDASAEEEALDDASGLRP